MLLNEIRSYHYYYEIHCTCVIMNNIRQARHCAALVSMMVDYTLGLEPWTREHWNVGWCKLSQSGVKVLL